jgi:hypothetical protein
MTFILITVRLLAEMAYMADRIQCPSQNTSIPLVNISNDTN